MIAALRTRSPGAWLGFAMASASLLVVLALPWGEGRRWPMVHLDGATGWVAVLIALTAMSRQIRNLARVSRFRAVDHVQTGCILAACLASDPWLTWLAIAGATVAGIAPMVARRWVCVPIAGAGLGLALFGATMADSGLGFPMLAVGCRLIGYAAVASVAPVLALPLLLLAFRLRGAETDVALIAGGLMGALTCAAWTIIGQSRLPPLFLGQAAVVVFAFGLGAPAADLAGMVHLTLLTLTASAVMLADRCGWQGFAARAGLAGAPPFGVFPGLAMVSAAAMTRAPWLLAPFLLALAAIAGATIARGAPPTGLRREQPGFALAPLALAAIAGWFMPAPVTEWLLTILAHAK